MVDMALTRRRSYEPRDPPTLKRGDLAAEGGLIAKLPDGLMRANSAGGVSSVGSVDWE
jgi:hypothetical protein